MTGLTPLLYISFMVLGTNVLLWLVRRSSEEFGQSGEGAFIF